MSRSLPLSHVRIRPRAIEGRLRLAVRWARFASSSAMRGWWDFVANALRAELALVALTVRDVLSRGEVVECNICGWKGREFYPNTGPGYDERGTLCPGCAGLDRHRSMLAVLLACTDFFGKDSRILEVAPMRGFQVLCSSQPGVNYTSFDPYRSAMEQGDITRMRFADGEADFFLCFHVLEHVPDEDAALREVARVVRPGGIAVFQVPMDWDAETTIEFKGPNWRDAGHVRQYGRDFADILRAYGFEPEAVSASEIVDHDERVRFGLSDEPIFLARRCERRGAESKEEV